MFDIHLSAPDLDFHLDLPKLINSNAIVSEFEHRLSLELDNKSVLAMNSGTAALHMALILLGVAQGDEVICQSLTYVASANPIVYLGASPVFVDSEPDTWNMCPDALETAIKDRLSKKKKIKAIVVVDLFGMPCKYNEILAISHRYGIPIIEDSAEALGSKYKNNKCGTFGDYSIISFNTNKIITTLGGGALICSDEKNKEKGNFLASQAKEKRPFYQHEKVGYNYLLSPLNALLGISQLDKLDKNVKVRRTLNQFYKNRLQTYDVKIHSESSTDFFSNHWLTVLELNSVTEKEQLYHLLSEHKIESRYVWKPMHLQPLFKSCHYYGSNLAEDKFAKGLCLPSGNNLTNEMKCRVFSMLDTFFK